MEIEHCKKLNKHELMLVIISLYMSNIVTSNGNRKNN